MFISIMHNLCLCSVNIYFQIFYYFYRVVEQHRLTREQWEERIVNWYAEHKGMIR